jgi:RNase P subunit RPR2
MTATNKQPGRHKIEKLLPWHATATLSRRDADRVEQALAGDCELARRYVHSARLISSRRRQVVPPGS